MTEPLRRMFGMHGDLDGGIRADALVTQSVAGLGQAAGQQLSVGGFRRWLAGVPLLVQIPGQPPYEACPRLWMTRDKYPIAGTTVPVTVDRSDPGNLRIEWDEVPEIDVWIVTGHPVFTDPDAVQAQLTETMTAHRAGVRRATTHGAAEHAADLMGPDAAVDRELAHQMVDRLQAAAEAQQPPPMQRPLTAVDRPTGRVVAASPGPNSRGEYDPYSEVLLSVNVPGQRRYGARWRGVHPPLKWMPPWSDVPVVVNPAHPDRVSIYWKGVPDARDVVTDRLNAYGDDLAAKLAAGPQATMQANMSMLLDAIPDPAQRATVQRQIDEAMARVAQPDPLDELKRLAQLRDTGALSEADFAAQKARLLDQI